MALVHHFDVAKGHWLSTLNVEDVSFYLSLPGYTDAALPAGWVSGDGRWAIRTDEGVWALVPDHRGQTWHDPETGAEERIADVGVTPSLGYVEGEAPASLATFAEAELQTAIADVCTAIEARMEELGHAPIDVNGVVWDADETAQRNITRKLQDIAQREDLSLPDINPAMLVWRDAANGMHQFDSQSGLRNRLGRVLCAISDRGTSLYIAAWRHKAAVRALANIAAVRAYNISDGWMPSTPTQETEEPQA